MWAGWMVGTERLSNRKSPYLESSDPGFDVSPRKGCLLDCDKDISVL